MNNDLISRKHLYRRIKTECNPYGKPTIDFESGKRVLDIIDNAPTVEPEKITCFGMRSGKQELLLNALRPKGEWKHEVIGDKSCVLCSICYLHFDNESNFCPNCGADMRGDDK